MARNYISLVCLLAVAIMGATAAHAQERTAGSSLELQMTWSSLKDQIDAARNNISLVSSKVDVIAACGKQGMVYAPGAPGNVNGCIMPAVPPSVTTAITNNTNAVNSVQTNVTNLLNCADSGKIFDKSSGTCSTADSTVVSLGAVSYNMSTGSSQSGNSGNYAIPAGTTVIAANVMCKVVGSKATIDSTMNFNNPGGYPANKFCYLAGVSKDNTATNMDTKYIPVPTGATVFSISYNATQTQNTTQLQGTMTFMGRK